MALISTGTKHLAQTNSKEDQARNRSFLSMITRRRERQETEKDTQERVVVDLVEEDKT